MPSHSAGGSPGCAGRARNPGRLELSVPRRWSPTALDDSHPTRPGAITTAMRHKELRREAAPGDRCQAEATLAAGARVLVGFTRDDASSESRARRAIAAAVKSHATATQGGSRAHCGQARLPLL